MPLKSINESSPFQLLATKLVLKRNRIVSNNSSLISISNIKKSSLFNHKNASGVFLTTQDREITFETCISQKPISGLFEEVFLPSVSAWSMSSSCFISQLQWSHPCNFSPDFFLNIFTLKSWQDYVDSQKPDEFIKRNCNFFLTKIQLFRQSTKELFMKPTWQSSGDNFSNITWLNKPFKNIFKRRNFP